MRTLQKIKEGFAYFKTIGQQSITLKEPYYWIVKLDGMQGVAIDIAADKKVNEQFASMKYYTKSYLIAGKERQLLMLVSDQESLRSDFAIICASFLEKVLDGEAYEQIQGNPLTWWHTMKELVGNANLEKAAYSVIGEMIGYYYVKSFEPTVHWNGPFGSSFDLETANDNYEVKSTTARYGSEITINSQYQLQSNFLLFFRFEPSVQGQGISIQDMVEKLVSVGVAREDLNKALEKLKYAEGSEVRLKSYRLLEATKYEINEAFPKITLESFKNEQLPQHITGLTYTIDLDGVASEAIALKLDE